MRFNINRIGEQIDYVYSELLRQIVTVGEWDKIRKLKVGERIEFPRDFGTKQPLIVERVES